MKSLVVSRRVAMLLVSHPVAAVSCAQRASPGRCESERRRRPLEQAICVMVRMTAPTLEQESVLRVYELYHIVCRVKFLFMLLVLFLLRSMFMLTCVLAFVCLAVSLFLCVFVYPHDVNCISLSFCQHCSCTPAQIVRSPSNAVTSALVQVFSKRVLHCNQSQRSFKS